MTKLFERVRLGEEVPMLDEFFDEAYENKYYDESLVEARKEFLKQLTEDQLKEVLTRDEYYHDDHELCIDVDITFTSGDVLSIGANWVSVELVGAFIYSDSKKAKSTIVDFLKDSASS